MLRKHSGLRILWQFGAVEYFSRVIIVKIRGSLPQVKVR